MPNLAKRKSKSLNPWTSQNCGYCTFLLTVTEPYESKVHVSRQTKKKVAATKEFLRQYYTDLYTTLMNRENRRQLVISRLNLDTQLTDEEKAAQLEAHFEKESQYMRRRRRRIAIKDFNILGLLGKGGYGAVYLCKKTDTDEILALKRMKKTRFTDKNEVHRVKKEREVMAKIHSPWLARLMYCFQSETHLYMAMEYIPGGDMKSLLDNMGCLAEEDAKFFMVEMLLAVDALHQAGYIHRDLKPDNFMIDREGHIKLIDFGLSREGVGNIIEQKTGSLRRRHTLKASQISSWTSNSMLVPTKKNSRRRLQSVVGSPEYMALEMLNESQYSHHVDYWSLGVILFEFMFGITPFTGDTVPEVFMNITNWKKCLAIPEFAPEEIQISDNCWNLITRLICPQETRIGYRGGMTEILEHPFFREVDIANIRDAVPPFIPNLEDELDTSYFNNVPDEDDLEQTKSIEALLEHTKTSDGEVIKAIYSYKDENNSESKHFGTTESDGEKFKFNSPSSKFEFQGFTFKHDELVEMQTQFSEMMNSSPRNDLEDPPSERIRRKSDAGLKEKVVVTSSISSPADSPDKKALRLKFRPRRDSVTSETSEGGTGGISPRSTDTASNAGPTSGNTSSDEESQVMDDEKHKKKKKRDRAENRDKLEDLPIDLSANPKSSARKIKITPPIIPVTDREIAEFTLDSPRDRSKSESKEKTERKYKMTKEEKKQKMNTNPFELTYSSPSSKSMKRRSEDRMKKREAPSKQTSLPQFGIPKEDILRHFDKKKRKEDTSSPNIHKRKRSKDSSQSKDSKDSSRDNSAKTSPRDTSGEKSPRDSPGDSREKLKDSREGREKLKDSRDKEEKHARGRKDSGGSKEKETESKDSPKSLKRLKSHKKLKSTNTPT